MENIPNGFYRTSIKALILDEKKKFLLMLEENGLWELPGGGIDFGESSADCLKRELKEEAGWEVTFIEQQPSYFVTGLNSNGVWKAIVVYKVRVKDLTFTPSEECVDVRFFSKEEALKEKLYPTVKAFINEFDPTKY